MEYKKIRPKKRKFKTNKVLYIFLLFLFIGIGYAALTTSLSINGTTNVATNSWNIHFANLHVQSGSVEGNAPTVSSNSISYAVTLAQPGDFYEFSVDIKNDGTLPGKISLVNLTGNNTNYLNTSYAYSNGDAITIGDIINAGKSRRLTIKAWITSDIDTSLLPTQDTPITLTFNLQYIQSEVDAPPDVTDQLIALSANSSCMHKYTGEVTDKVGVTEQANNVYFDRCADKRNVIFNNICWEIIRTTETGGIKMIYNGEPDLESKCARYRNNHKGIVGAEGTTTALNDSYLYGTSFTYDTTTNSFTLVDTITATWSDSTYSSLLGMFTCKSSTGTCTTLYNVNSYKSNTDAYVATYSINDTNYAQIGTSPFNANRDSLAMVGYMFNKSYNRNILSRDSGTLVGNNVSYENGTYTLLPADGESELGTTIDTMHHYTCNNTSGTCSTVRYYYHGNSYIELDGAANIEEAITEMNHIDNINKYNSNIKGIIDSWYKQNMYSKTNKLENAVYCNSREIINLNGWNPNGGSIDENLKFKNELVSTDISCLNEIDQFSVNNNNAKLIYPVSLLEDEERQNIYDSSLIMTGALWWTISPSWMNDYTNGRRISSGGGGTYDYVYYSFGVRPVISLAPGNTFASGTGSESDPWVIQE